MVSLQLWCPARLYSRSIIIPSPRGEGATLGTETFTDLDYADDVALLAEMLEVLLLALDVLKDEAHPLGLEVNWQKTKIQSTIDPAALPQSVLLSGNSVDIVFLTTIATVVYVFYIVVLIVFITIVYIVVRRNATCVATIAIVAMSSLFVL